MSIIIKIENFLKAKPFTQKVLVSVVGGSTLGILAGLGAIFIVPVLSEEHLYKEKYIEKRDAITRSLVNKGAKLRAHTDNFINDCKNGHLKKNAELKKHYLKNQQQILGEFVESATGIGEYYHPINIRRIRDFILFHQNNSDMCNIDGPTPDKFHMRTMQLFLSKEIHDDANSTIIYNNKKSLVFRDTI